MPALDSIRLEHMMLAMDLVGANPDGWPSSRKPKRFYIRHPNTGKLIPAKLSVQKAGEIATGVTPDIRTDEVMKDFIRGLGLTLVDARDTGITD